MARSCWSGYSEVSENSGWSPGARRTRCGRCRPASLERICVRAPYLMGRTIHMMLQMNCSYDSSGPHTEQLICSCSSPQSASSSRYLCFSQTSLVDESAECLYPVTLHLQTEQISSRCSGFMLASKRSLVICGCGCAS